jgi:hypothetical protein
MFSLAAWAFVLFHGSPGEKQIAAKLHLGEPADGDEVTDVASGHAKDRCGFARVDEIFGFHVDSKVTSV